MADDPRGALRWTLSRLRSALPDGSATLQTDRESVWLSSDHLVLDAAQLARLQGASPGSLSTAQLERAASLYRGELLEGLELPDFLEYRAWCVSQQEALRRTQCALLQELVTRSADAPADGLPWARQWAQLDAFNVQAHEALLSLLLAEGLAAEAERRHEHAVRQFRQVAAPDADALERAWQVLRAGTSPRPGPLAPVIRGAAPPSAAVAPHTAPSDAAPVPFVGRRRMLAQIGEVLESSSKSRSRHAVLLQGEPGAGKSRLLERVRSDAISRGFEVLSARAFDLERGRPFGPWIDALEVAPDALIESAQSGGRAQLFDKLTALVRERAAGSLGVVLIFDDLQWLDRDSAEALHHLLQSYGDGVLLALLAARGGELPDNAPVEHVVRSLKRDRILHELELEPLAREEVRALLGEQGGLDLDRIMQACAGNPLYALELSRGAREGASVAPPTLVQLVRERVGRLSDAACDVLRWAAVLGYTFDAERLESLSELSQMDVVLALEELERHALLRIDATRSRERYAFSHDVVREATYGELSHPRRRLMHRKVAHLLAERTTDPATAHEVARHASLAGEVHLGVQACIAAAQYALRTCANSDAEALARRGLHQVVELDEAQQVTASLDLLHVLYSARAPDHDEATQRVRALAERALDLGLTKPARIGFQMLSYLRWESASMADAHENILQAERVSRSADPDERSQALAHAARCLVLLERNLGQAEAFMLEARGVAERSGRTSAAVAFALGMIAAHRGEQEVADVALLEAQDLARANGERLAEFGALEHRVMLSLDLGTGGAEVLSSKLVELAARVRPGAEVAIARALHALSALLEGDGDEAALVSAVTELRAADAKYELSFVLTRWGKHVLSQDAIDAAARIAQDGLEVARAIGRSSEEAIASLLLADVARRRGDGEAAGEHLRELEAIVESDLSATARALWAQLDRAATAPPQ